MALLAARRLICGVELSIGARSLSLGGDKFFVPRPTFDALAEPVDNGISKLFLPSRGPISCIGVGTAAEDNVSVGDKMGCSYLRLRLGM